jgi:hypothetical protein
MSANLLQKKLRTEKSFAKLIFLLNILTFKKRNSDADSVDNERKT